MEFVDRAVFSWTEQESADDDGGGVVGSPTTPGTTVFSKGEGLFTFIKVIDEMPEWFLFGDSMADIEISVKPRVERRCSFENVVCVVGRSGGFPSIEVKEIDLAAKRSDDDFLDAVRPLDIDGLPRPSSTTAPNTMMGMGCVGGGGEGPFYSEVDGISVESAVEVGISAE